MGIIKDIVIIVAMCLCFVPFAKEYYSILASSNWKVVSARVINATDFTFELYAHVSYLPYQANVTYQFKTEDGTTETIKQCSSWHSKLFAWATAAKWNVKPGDQIAVRYNPENPAQSVSAEIFEKYAGASLLEAFGYAASAFILGCLAAMSTEKWKPGKRYPNLY